MLDITHIWCRASADTAGSLVFLVSVPGGFLKCANPYFLLRCWQMLQKWSGGTSQCNPGATQEFHNFSGDRSVTWSQQIHSTHICRPMQWRYCSGVWSHRGWKGGLRGNREGSQPPTRLPGTLLLQCFTRLPALTASGWHTPQVHQPPLPAKTKQPPANFRGIQLRSVGHGFPPSSPAWMLPGAFDWSRWGTVSGEVS